MTDSELTAEPRPFAVWSRESLFAVVVLAAVLVVAFGDVVFMGRTLRASNSLAAALPSGHLGYAGEPLAGLPMYDNTPAVLEEPYLELKRRAFDAHVVPLWNPHQAAGYPLLATMESSLFYALDLVLYVVRGPWAWDLFYLLRLLATGLFSYWLLRELGGSPLAAFAAGAAYMLSGPLIAWVANVTTSVDILLPLLVFFVERTLRRPNRRYVVGLALVVFQMVAAGHPEHTFFALLAGLIYAVARWMQHRDPFPRAAVLTRWGLAGVAGLGLSAVLVLPFVEYLIGFAWHAHSPDVGLEALGVEQAASILFPWWDSKELVSLRPWTYNTWPGGWLGLLPVWLTLFVVAARPFDRRATPFLAVLLLFLLKIFGVPPVQWLGYLPVFDVVKFPLHATQVVGFAVAVLVGLAVAALESGPRVHRPLWVALAAVVALTVVLALADPPGSPPSTVWGLGVALVVIGSGAVLATSSGWRRSGFLAATMLLLLLVEAIALVPRQRAGRARTYKKPPYVTFLERDTSPHRVYGLDFALFPNTATAFGLDDLGIYEGLYVRRFAIFVHQLVDARAFAPGTFPAFRAALADPDNRFLDLLNLKYLILPRESRAIAERWNEGGFEVVYDAEVVIVERLRALPRARILGAALFVDSGAAALELLKSGFDFRREVLLEGSALRGSSGRIADLSQSRVESMGYGWNRKSFEVELDGDGYLVIQDVTYPGWRATVDGQPSELLTADYLFQAVPLAAGRHRVELIFRPRTVVWGALVSLFSLVALVGWACVGRRGRAPAVGSTDERGNRAAAR